MRLSSVPSMDQTLGPAVEVWLAIMQPQIKLMTSSKRTTKLREMPARNEGSKEDHALCLKNHRNSSLLQKETFNLGG